MRCLQCGSESPEGVRFCRACGAELTTRCKNCGIENSPASRFCGACGVRLNRTLPPDAAYSPPADGAGMIGEGIEAGPAERRQLTVMFCDLVGSTALSERMDPEDLRAVVQAYQKAASKVIRRFDGHVAQYLGDGILVYFGYPKAHEQDAYRAVLAGLGLLGAIDRLNDTLEETRGLRIAVRVGIHTGLVVIGEIGGGGRQEWLALGETPNVAAWIQGRAEENSVFISADTYRLVEGLFHCRDQGAHALKGASRLLTVYKVLHQSTARSRLDVAEMAGLTPLVGREQEVGLLIKRWELTREGYGHILLLSGEAGIGKSRLVHALKEHAAQNPQSWLTECRCSPFQQDTALYPLVDLFERIVLRFSRKDGPEEKLRKIEGYLVQFGLELDDMVPLFASLLNVPLRPPYQPSALSPERQKWKILQAVLRILQALSERQPLLFVVEDLHWADPTSLELLNVIIERIAASRILAVFTFRSEFVPPWQMRSHMTHLTLTRLTHGQVGELAEHVARGKPLPKEVLDQVVLKTDGVPLFVEELTKAILESDLVREHAAGYTLEGPLPALSIPATLRDSLMARLDRRPQAREVAQLAATIGREFTPELLEAVWARDEASLERELEYLVRAEMLYRRDLPPQPTYVFKHALIQETAYQSLLHSARQRYHHRIATAMLEEFPEILDAQPEVLARHMTEAGLYEEAVSLWRLAGRLAIQHSAHVEAVQHLNRGLRLLPGIEDEISRDELELAVRVLLGPALVAIKGYAAPEVEQVYKRARELCRSVSETPHLVQVLRGLIAFYFVRADLDTAQALGEQLYETARAKQEPAWHVEAHLALGETALSRGAFVEARDHLEQGAQIYAERAGVGSASLDGQDPGVGCLSQLSQALWVLGYPDQARRRALEAAALAERIGNPFRLAYALVTTVIVLLLRGDARDALDQAVRAVRLSEEQKFPLWSTAATFAWGWALMEVGDAESGIAHMEQGLAGYRSTGALIGVASWPAALADAYARAGRVEAGLDLLERTLEHAEQTGERGWEAELYRLKGTLLLRTERGEDRAAVCLEKAVETARRQQARSWELRAVRSLSRFLIREGRREEARVALAEVYGRFDEGFGLRDLQETADLLRALS